MNEEVRLELLRKELERQEKQLSEHPVKALKEEFVCESGIPIKRVYTPLDLAERGFDYLTDLGLPGEYPFTRGITPNMYRTEMWRMQKYTGHPTPEESNKSWKEQIAAGMTALSIAFDLPTQLGYDPDDPKAEGEVGRIGLSCCSLYEFETVLDGIDLNKVMVNQVINAPAIVGLGFYLALVEKRGMDLKTVRGALQNDILKEFISRGNYIFPPGPSVRLSGDILVYCAENLPRFNAMQVSGVHPSERGANPVHEIAAALAMAFAYLKTGVERGASIDDIASHLEFIPSIAHHGFFQEVAKLRALRRIYARVLREQFGAKNPESCRASVYVAQGGTSLYKEQYLLNIGRQMIAALAGALAGVNALNLRTYDEVFGIPTTEALINAIQCGQVVAYETGVTDTVDPLGGSYFVESLTCEFENRINEELKNIDRQGGVVQCIQSGYFQRQFAQDAYRFQKDFEAGKILRVGVNSFTREEQLMPTTIYRVNPAVEQKCIDTVRDTRRKRDNARVKKALEEIKVKASLPPSIENNLVPPVCEAVKAYATVGEICGALKEVWGVALESTVF